MMSTFRLAACAAMLAWSAVCVAGGSIDIVAKDSDGKAKGDVYLARWDDKADAYTPVISRALRLGKVFLKVVPGKYKVTIRYTETFPEQRQEFADVEVMDGQTVALTPMFDKGWSEISVWDNDNGGEGLIYYERWDDAKQQYVHVTSKEIRPRDNRKMTPLAPGRYRITFKYKETMPKLEIGSAEIEIEGGVINVQQFHARFAPERK